MSSVEDEFGEELGGDPVEGGDNDGYDGGGDSGGGGSGGGGASDGALWSSVDVLTAFANNPRGFVVGAVLTTLLEAVTGAVTTVVDAIVRLVGGSQPTAFAAPGETLGLADLPVAFAQTLTSAGGFGGRAIINGIESFNGTIFEAAAAAGPFAPLVIIVVASIEAIAVILVLRRIVFVAADLLQLGGLTE
jgi:hypothetical protein